MGCVRAKLIHLARDKVRWRGSCEHVYSLLDCIEAESFVISWANSEGGSFSMELAITVNKNSTQIYVENSESDM